MYNNQYWNEHWVVPLCQQGREITLHVRNQNELSSTHFGRVTISVRELLAGEVHDWRPIKSSWGKCNGYLLFKLKFVSVEEKEKRGEYEVSEVPNCYFKGTLGNKIKLYSCSR